MTLAETFEKPRQKGGDLAGHKARKMAEKESLAAEMAKKQAALGPVTLEEFEGKRAEVTEALSGFGYDIKVSFRKGSSADVRVAQELSLEQVTAVRSAGSLAPTKPKGFGDGPA